MRNAPTHAVDTFHASKTMHATFQRQETLIVLEKERLQAVCVQSRQTTNSVPQSATLPGPLFPHFISSSLQSSVHMISSNVTLSSATCVRSAKTVHDQILSLPGERTSTYGGTINTNGARIGHVSNQLDIRWTNQGLTNAVKSSALS